MDRRLVDRAMAGDHEAFAELARLSIGRLYAVARLILRDEDRAEDATQEALVAAWRDLAALRRPRPLRGLAAPAARPRVLSRGASRTTPAGGSISGSTCSRVTGVADDSVTCRPRPARARLPPPRAGAAGAHRPPLLRRPPPDGDGRHPRVPVGTVKSRLHRPPRPCAPPSSRRAQRPPEGGRHDARADFDRLLTAWLDDRAPVARPTTCLVEVLARTSRTRRRPGWLIPERSTHATHAGLAAHPATGAGAVRSSRCFWRPCGLLVVGGRRHLPPPYGLAATASSPMSTMARSGSPRRTVRHAGQITTTAGVKGLPLFSRDGTRIAFLTYASVFSLGPASLSVADTDGGRSVVIDPDTYFIDPPSWSPDGRLLVYGKAPVSDEGAGRVYVAASDGSSPPRLVGVERLGRGTRDSPMAPGSRSSGSTQHGRSHSPVHRHAYRRFAHGPLSRGVFRGHRWGRHGAWDSRHRLEPRRDQGPSARDRGRTRIVRRRPDGATPERVIATGPLLEYAATWSPSGTQVAFFRGPRFDFPDSMSRPPMAHPSGASRRTSPGSRHSGRRMSA